MTKIPNKPREKREFMISCREDDMDRQVEKHLWHEHDFIRAWRVLDPERGVVPIVGNEEVTVLNRYLGRNDVPIVTVNVTFEYLRWPEGAELIKYITYDGYVEWKSTPHSKSKKS